MSVDGYIKFSCVFVSGEPPSEQEISEMNDCRNTLYRMGLIGQYENGIGFGNISIRSKNGKIIISGTRTGSKEILEPADYSIIEDYSIDQNFVICSGKAKASSETLTHLGIYECSKQIGCVIHIHSLFLWKNLINVIPTSSPNATYGTPDIAKEIKRLYEESDAPVKRVIALGGHREGIIAFGKDVSRCFSNLIDIIAKVK